MAAQTSVKVATQTGAAKDDLFNAKQVTEDSRVTSLDVLANDPGSAKLWSVNQDAATVNVASGSKLITLKSGAKITINANGTITYDASGIAGLDALNATESFTDSFTYTIRMANGALSVATATVVIAGENDAATISGVKTGVLNEDGASLTTGGTLIVHDVDHGEAVFAAVDPSALVGSYGRFTFDSATGKWGYALDNGSAGVQALRGGEEVFDTLVVTSRDGTATETIRIKVVGTNDAAVIGDLTGSAVTEDQNVSGGALAVTGTLSITDADHGESSFRTTVTGAQGNLGTLTLAADGSYSYTVDNAAVQYLGAGQTKVETFTVTALDGTTKDVAFTINGVNDAPILTDASFTLAGGTEDIAYVVRASDLLAGYTDVDSGDTLSVTGLTASHGSLVDNHNGTWTFIPEANYNGKVDLSYGVTDGTVTVAASRGFELAAVADTFSFDFTVGRTAPTTTTTSSTSVNALTYTGAPPTDQNLFSQQYGDWVRSLAYLGKDVDGDGVVQTAWHQNSSTNTIAIEGSNLSFGSTAYTISTGNTTQTRYYAAGLTASTTTTTTTTTPGSLTVTPADDQAVTIDNFQFGSDMLSFTGVGGLSSTEFDSVFSLSQADVTGDGTVDTTIALKGSAWSVTLAGVHDAPLNSLIAG